MSVRTTVALHVILRELVADNTNAVLSRTFSLKEQHAEFEAAVKKIEALYPEPAPVDSEAVSKATDLFDNDVERYVRIAMAYAMQYEGTRRNNQAEYDNEVKVARDSIVLAAASYRQALKAANG